MPVTTDRSSPGVPIGRQLPVTLTRTAIPAPPEEPHDFNRFDEGRYLRRIVGLSLFAAALGAFIYLMMEDPFNWGIGVSLSWQGLFVYSSIVALACFLALLLVRYFGVLYMSYMYSAKYTAMEEGYADQFDPAKAYLPPVSILIPAYNEAKLIERTVRSLLAMDYPHFEILVVDDGSNDGTSRVVEPLVRRYVTADGGFAEVKLITKPNGGKSTALNAGLNAAAYDIVLCVDGDSELEPETLRRAVRHFQDPQIGAVAGNVKVKNRKNLWTRLQALEYVEGLNMVRSAQSTVRLVNIIPGPVGLFRRDALRDAGFYSSDTFAEDCDVTLKMLRAGWRVVYEPEAISWTEAPESYLDLLKQRYRWTRGILQAVRKHKQLFFNPWVDGKANWGGTAVMWMMAFESLIWPVMNVFANLFFVAAAFFGYAYYLVLWWLSLTLLDFAAAVYCVATEKEDPKLIPYALLYRSFFILMIDVAKCFATIEELLGLGMTWGKLERVGGGSGQVATA